MAKDNEKFKDRSRSSEGYLKKLRKLGEELSTLRDLRRKQEKKFAKELTSYEKKLKDIDEKLRL